MRTPARTLAPISLVALLVPLPLLADAESAKNWPQFRGPAAAGIGAGQPVPLTWNVSTGENVAWSTKIAGLGLSSPIVWGDRIFLTTAVGPNPEAELKVGLYGDIMPIDDDGEHDWQVLCLERGSGKLIWQKSAHRGAPAVKRHPKASHANSTPATDGKHVVAFFGSEGLYCFDVDGELLWSKDFGVLDSGFFMVPSAQWGFGSSPIIHDRKVIIQVDVQGESFVAAYDVTDGKEIWKTKREEAPTWSTPAVCTTSDPAQVICNGWKHIGGYRLDNGEELWKLIGGGDIPVPTPILGHDLVFITNAHGMMAPIYAIRTSARGLLTAKPDAPGPHAAWLEYKGGNYMQTPLVHGDHLYMCLDNGVMACYDAKTGERKFKARLGSGKTGFTASPVLSDGRLYYTAEDGSVHVVKATNEFEELAVNEMGSSCMATPAISDGLLLIRSRDGLVAIGEGGLR